MQWIIKLKLYKTKTKREFLGICGRKVLILALRKITLWPHTWTRNLTLENRRREIELYATSNLCAPRHADNLMISTGELNGIINSFKNHTRRISNKYRNTTKTTCFSDLQTATNFQLFSHYRVLPRRVKNSHTEIYAKEQHWQH